jgi:hypothetical protein
MVVEQTVLQTAPRQQEKVLRMNIVAIEDRAHYAYRNDRIVTMDKTEFVAYLATLDPNEGYADARAFDREYASSVDSLMRRHAA